MIRLRTLGTLDLRDHNGAELRAVLAQPRRLALLAYLAVAFPRGFRRRDQLLTLFWGDQDEDRARASLSRACYFLRKELGEGVLVSRGTHGIGLNDDQFWCDASAFQALVETERVTEGLELYRGDLLPGFYASNASAFEAWLETERPRLRDRAADAAWKLADREEAAGNLLSAAQWARRGVELAPFTEAGLRKLLVLLDRAGDRSAAAHAYERFSAQLGAELELSPSVETQRVIEAIRERTRLPLRDGEIAAQSREWSGLPPQLVAPDPDETTSPSALDSSPRIESLGVTSDAALGEPPGATRRRPRRRVVAFALVGALLTVAAGLVVFRGPRAPFDPSLVAVERFRNATREPRVDALIRDATDDIAASLIRTGVAKRVARLDATRSWTRVVRHIAVRSVARTPSARPSIGVSGTITRQGDRLLVQVSIADYRRAGKTWGVAPVTVAMNSPAGSIDEVRRRTLGGVAALENAALESYIRVASPPPTFEAYEEFVEGSMLEARGDFPAALRHYGWAAALDTTFTFPLVTGALTSLMRGTAEPTDSLLRILSAVSNRLPPLQRRLLDYMLAVRAENWTAAHDAIRDAAQMAPERFSYRLAIGATHLNRPREAVEALSQHGMDSIFKDAVQSYWLVLTLSLHQLGEHRTELAAARRARRNRPQSASALAQEVRALAALGRVDAVQSLLDSVLTLPRDGWFTPAQVFMAAGLELRAHGYPEPAAAAFARAIAWHKARPNDERSSDLRREQLAFVLYAAGALDEADTVFRSLAAAHPDVPEYWGPVGTIAARRADRAAAEAIAERLSHIEHPAPAPGQEAIVWRARIAALLGDPDQSMRLLIDAFGNQGTAQLHGDMDFAGLASHPGFRDFVRPKG